MGVSRCSGCSGCLGFYANFLTILSWETCGKLTFFTDEKDDAFFAREPVDGISKHRQHPADQQLIVVEDVPEELYLYGGWKVEPQKRWGTCVIYSSNVHESDACSRFIFGPPVQLGPCLVPFFFLI
jgi:hypothetical protein